jgi:general secretion pathway protein I
MSGADDVAIGSNAKTARPVVEGHGGGLKAAAFDGLRGRGDGGAGSVRRSPDSALRGAGQEAAAEGFVRGRLRNARRGDGLQIPAAGRSTMRGYTLIEVIVAFAILALALTLLLGTLSGAARQIRWADEAGRAALHAQSLLDQVGVGEALLPGHRDGDFEQGRYRWSLDVAPYQDTLLPPPVAVDLSAPRLLQLSLTVRWGEDGNDPRRRLQVQSLRLVTPNPVDAVPPP